MWLLWQKPTFLIFSSPAQQKQLKHFKDNGGVMWEKVKDKEREHTSSPVELTLPIPLGESSSTSWKSRDLRRSRMFGTSQTAGPECLSPVWAQSHPWHCTVGTAVNEWQRKRRGRDVWLESPSATGDETATSTEAGSVYVMAWDVNSGSVGLFQSALGSWMPLMQPPAYVQNAVFHVLLLSLNIFE